MEGKSTERGNMNIKDGGPAFPQGKFTRTNAGYNGGQLDVCEEMLGGMSLRDWLAGKALIGILTAGIGVKSEDEKEYSLEKHKVAACCYQYADAMIAERNK